MASAVYSVELLGDATMASFKVGDGLVSIRGPKTFRAGIGDTVRAAIPAAACHLFDCLTGTRIGGGALIEAANTVKQESRNPTWPSNT